MGRIRLFRWLFQNGCSQSSRFATAGQGERRLWERDCAEVRSVRYRNPLCEASADAKSTSLSGYSPPEKNPLSLWASAEEREASTLYRQTAKQLCRPLQSTPRPRSSIQLFPGATTRLCPVRIQSDGAHKRQNLNRLKLL